MRFLSTAKPSSARTTAGFGRQPLASAVAKPRSDNGRRRSIGAVVGVILIGALAGGCGGSGAVSGGSDTGKVLTSTQHDARASTTTSTTALPNCGSNRDPFDPTGSPAPAGSPAVC